jgi:aspartate racemase
MTAKIGLVGGVGWPATVAYYRAICRAAKDQGLPGTPPMTIESLDMSQTMAARGTAEDEDSWQSFDTLFSDALNRLENVGCEVGAIASVTPHNRLAAIKENTSIPIISVVDAVSEQIESSDCWSVLVLGTSVTMQSSFFDQAFERQGCKRIFTGASKVAVFSDLLDRYFYAGKAAEGRNAMMGYVKSCAPRSDDVLVLLACTDLTPAFPEAQGNALFKADGYRFLDATTAHVDAILQFAL